ncbi:MFS transporter [Tumebacillus sp. ITR2]|uniref:MFS transporter n=1 Tax=Tumebacillus amylolyticus TaxID=2801339 RepID=A0ABS1J7G3_9BACL|nr:MFS transporter [Tumebacillus amylolyticus]MBL0385603.1 MFS transporter [Tumebacillus amylolyticus]
MMNNQGRRDVVTIALITAICLFGDSMLYVVLPIHWRDGGLTSLFEVGLLLSVNRFVRLPLNPFVTWLYQRISLRTGMAIAIVIAGITTAGYGLGKGFVAWLICRCLWGASWSLLRLGSYFSIVNSSTSVNRGYLMGMYNGLYRLGSLIGMLVGSFAVEKFGMRNVSLLFALLTVVAIPLVFRSSSSNTILNNQQRTPTLLGGIAENWKDKSWLLMLGSGMLLAYIYQGVLASTLSLTIQQNLPEGFLLLGVTIEASSLAGFLQALRWGWEPFVAPRIGFLSDGPRGRMPYFLISLVLAAILFWFIPSPLPRLLWFGVLLFVQLTATLLTTLMDAIASDMASARSNMGTMSTYSFLVDFGAALGPFLAFQLGDSLAYHGASLLLVILAVCWYKIRPQKKTL